MRRDNWRMLPKTASKPQSPDTTLRHQRLQGEVPWLVKLTAIALVAGLQLGTFFATYQFYHVVAYDRFVDLATTWDTAIPYIRGSWVIYYFGFCYIPVWAGIGIWRLSRTDFHRTIGVYGGLVISGAILHLVIPTQAPWPLEERLTSVQHGFKTLFSIEPLACFPSMHVALAVLPCLISLVVIKSAFGRVCSIVLSTAVCFSVVTAKEHWVLDAVSGFVLGLIGFWIWYRLVPRRWKARSAEGK